MPFRLLYGRASGGHIRACHLHPQGRAKVGVPAPAAKYSQMNGKISAASSSAVVEAADDSGKLGFGSCHSLFCELDDRFGAGADHLAFDLRSKGDRNALGADAAA